MNLREKAIKGFAWSAIEKWGQQILNSLVFLILARALSPDDFGLLAMASVFIAFFGVFLDQGLKAAVVQRTDLERKHLDTAFWATVLMGSFLTAAGISLSGMIANIYGEPRLEPIVTWQSIGFFMASLSSTQQAILQREMDFRSLAIRSLVAKASGGIVGVSMAILGFGVWSLVAQSLVNSFAAVIVLWKVSDWRPGFHFSGKHFRHMFSFGINVLGAKIINFFDLRVDDFLIGYFLGATALGFYSIAYRILLMLQDLIMGLSHRVVVTTFSRIQEDVTRLRNAFYQMSQLIIFVTWPIFLGIMVISSELIPVFFGEQWKPSVPVMQILAVAGIPLTSLFISEQLAIAVGKPSWNFWNRFFISISRIIGFALVAKWGIVAIATIFMFTNYVIYTPANLWLAHRLIKLDFRKYFGYYVGPMVGSMVMVIIVMGTKKILSVLLGLYWQVSLYVFVGALVYCLVLWYSRPDIFNQLLGIFQLIFARSRIANNN